MKYGFYFPDFSEPMSQEKTEEIWKRVDVIVKGKHRNLRLLLYHIK